MIEAINLRLLLLHIALQYSSEKTAMLSTGERIEINQERGHLMRQKTALEENPEHQVYWFAQSQKIENKLTTIDSLIKATNWKSSNEN